MNFKEEIVIEPGKNWFAESVRELIRYKDLLYFMVIRGIKAKYAQSVLGVSWAIIQPLFTTVVFTIIFGNLVKVSSDGMPYILFSFSGMVIWNYFSNTLTEASNSVVQNASMITKVYFPRIILPLSAAFSKLLDFVIGLAVLIGFLLYFQVVPSLNVLWLPVVVLVMLLFSLGIGSFLSALAVQYRDVKHALSFVVQILMYACPVVYPSSVIPEQYQLLYALNPMVGVIEGFRAAFIPTLAFPYMQFGIGALVSMAVFVGGTAYFNKFERKFADVA
ncbi:transport permease protein [Thermaurantimonas aggregans]|uniref:Transport permease protein n=1 Tax=Thermaurantimonas aggregans TaxID=2173829 RepID=A0A401XK10_9FLAO|nr:ABC transporter permease [Thermaurantimonas aggregans]MCX8148570.1 ABC transporter permease [Thermaurantimonas aggregans]GCD77356.1 transport permease protein [Thermaurantimonas aggregans]